MNLLSLTHTQLRRAADLKEKIESLTEEVASILGGSVAKTVKAFKKGMSAAGRAKVSAAQKKRWAKIKKAKPVKRRKMSKAAKAKISAAAKARWAKVKSAGKKSL